MKFRTTYVLFGFLVLALGFLVYKVVTGAKKGQCANV